MFDCNSEGYLGLTKDAASGAKITTENNFDALSWLLSDAHSLLNTRNIFDAPSPLLNPISPSHK